MNKKDIVEKKTRILKAILSYHFYNTIRTYYHGVEDFLKSLEGFYGQGKTTQDNRSLGRYVSLFSIPVKDIISPVKIDGKLQRITKEVIENLKEFKLVGKKDIRFKSGKVFSRPSFWLIDKNYVKKILEDKKPLEEYQPEEIRAIKRFLGKQKENHIVRDIKKEFIDFPEDFVKDIISDNLTDYRLKRSQTNQDGVRLRSTVSDIVLPSLTCN